MYVSRYLIVFLLSLLVFGCEAGELNKNKLIFSEESTVVAPEIPDDSTSDMVDISLDLEQRRHTLTSDNREFYLVCLLVSWVESPPNKTPP